jgi:hypothetical protein
MVWHPSKKSPACFWGIGIHFISPLVCWRLGLLALAYRERQLKHTSYKPARSKEALKRNSHCSFYFLVDMPQCLLQVFMVVDEYNRAH